MEAARGGRLAAPGSGDEQGKALAAEKTKMEVSELSVEELGKFRAKVKPVIDKYATTIGPEFVKEFSAEIEKVRK